MNRSRVPYRRVLLPVFLALTLAAESVAVAFPVFAQSSASEPAAAAVPFVPLPSEPDVRERSVDDTLALINPFVAPIAEPVPTRPAPERPTTAAVNKVKSQPKSKASGGGSGGSGGYVSSASYRGTNRMWFPALGINRSVSFYSCSNQSYPGNVVYRWGCAGANNVYLFGHAHSVFKPLHDAYVGGRLKKGMKVTYADGKGRVRTYKLIWWKVTTPTNGTWAYAGQSTPSLTLQTCVGANSQYRLIVRFVQV